MVTANDYLRAFMFIVIAFVVAVLSERIAKSYEKIAHLNAILSAIRNVNQLIAMEKDRDRLLKGACERLTETRGYHNAWIALLDEAGMPVATSEAGLGEDFLPMVERLKRGELPACGQKALSEPGIVVTQDPLSTCTDCPLVEKYGGRWAMTVRLEHGEKLYGLLSVSIPGEVTAGEEERSLFDEVANDLAFALHSIELEEGRKQAEEELKREKNFSENIITTVPDSLVVVDKDLRIKKANLSFQKIFWIEPEKAVGTRITDILGDEDEKLSTVLSKLLGTKTTVENLELHYYSEKLGERIFHIAARGIIQAEEGGQEDEVLVVIEDITERKRGEEVLLRFSEELELKVKERTKDLAKDRDYTRHLIESSPDSQMILDKDGKIMDVNEAFEHMVGKGHEDLIGSSIYEYLPKEETEKAIAEIFEQGKVRDIELTFNIPGKEAF